VLDAGEGAVLFGEASPLPRGLGWVAIGALVASVVLAFLASLGSGACALACALLSVVYSHPRTAWKGHALLGPMVNVAGYGVLSLVAGWGVADVPWTARGLASVGVTAAWALGLYFAAQVFQEADDRAHGWRTLVATHGSQVTRRAARVAFLVGDAVLLGLVVAGWYPRLCGVVLPVLVLRDRRLRGVGDEGGVRAVAFLVLLGGLAVVAGASAQYVLDCFAGGAVSGMATVRGAP